MGRDDENTSRVRDASPETLVNVLEFVVPGPNPPAMPTLNMIPNIEASQTWISQDTTRVGDVPGSMKADALEGNDELPIAGSVSRDDDDNDADSLITQDNNPEMRPTKDHPIRALLEDTELIGIIVELKEEMSMDLMKTILMDFLDLYGAELESPWRTQVESESAELLSSHEFREQLAEILIHKSEASDFSEDEDFGATTSRNSIQNLTYGLSLNTSRNPKLIDPAAEYERGFRISAYNVNINNKRPDPNDIEEPRPLMRLSFAKLLEKLQSQAIRVPYVGIRDTLMAVHNDDIEFCFSTSASWSAQLRSYVERNSTGRWNWWPLSPPRVATMKGDCRILWRCNCRLHHFQDLPEEDAYRLRRLLRLRCSEPDIDQQHCQKKLRKHRNSATSFMELLKIAIRGSYTEVTAAAPTAAVPDSSSHVTAPSQAFLGSSTQNSSRPTASNYNVAGSSGSFATTGLSYHPLQSVQVNTLNAPSVLKLLLGVEQGFSQRQVVPLDLRLRPVKNDAEFIWRLRDQYKSARGKLKLWFSVFRLDTCVFSLFEQPRKDTVLHGKIDWPDNDSDYEYSAGAKKPPCKSRPPIKEDQFRCDLKFCNQHCLWELLNPWHECRGSAEHTLVVRVPKKKSDWTYQQSSDNKAWGLDCRFEISALGVLVYHAIMIASTLVFWGWWQSVHPNDVASAGVPISVMSSLISAFWAASGVIKFTPTK